MKGIRKAVRLLKKGKVLILPTETVYGMMCDAMNEDAINKIYDIKKRPRDKALSVLIAHISDMEKWAIDIPDIAYQLAEHFWPGPMTLILKKAPHVPSSITAGQDTIGLRIPKHPLTLQIIEKFASGVCAPSANFAGATPPSAYSEIDPKLRKAVCYTLDGGPCTVGVSSTIIDLTQAQPTIIREGMIQQHHLDHFINQ